MKDNNGEPVIGASVREAGTSNGTITDLEGNFVLDVSAEIRNWKFHISDMKHS